jgi:hypothetical protein
MSAIGSLRAAARPSTPKTGRLSISNGSSKCGTRPGIGSRPWNAGESAAPDAAGSIAGHTGQITSLRMAFLSTRAPQTGGTADGAVSPAAAGSGKEFSHRGVDSRNVAFGPEATIPWFDGSTRTLLGASGGTVVEISPAAI